MGVVEAVGPEVKSLKKGDRAVASFEMACGSCVYCKASFFSGCDRTNPRWAPQQERERKLAQIPSEPAWAASGPRRCGALSGVTWAGDPALHADDACWTGSGRQCAPYKLPLSSQYVLCQLAVCAPAPFSMEATAPPHPMSAEPPCPVALSHCDACLHAVRSRRASMGIAPPASMGMEPAPSP